MRVIFCREIRARTIYRLDRLRNDVLVCLDSGVFLTPEVEIRGLRTAFGTAAVCRVRATPPLHLYSSSPGENATHTHWRPISPGGIGPQIANARHGLRWTLSQIEAVYDLQVRC